MAKEAVAFISLLIAFIIPATCDQHFGIRNITDDENHMKQHLQNKINVSDLTAEQQR
ncbi:hypothetical protein TELCIR_02587 [Teladorsagia circumcincta]|uniref:Uncharacterized protein n=1 Tax=Teladorsagia circumcincta TaxID=45464 RepID=A0A2G9UYQ6_TELCI|nr:hypothetical protein TELCIR_02587 [Teladorsagia circumcincta]